MAATEHQLAGTGHATASVVAALPGGKSSDSSQAAKTGRSGIAQRLREMAIEVLVWTTFLALEGYRCFVEPILAHLGIINPGFGDPTYGRTALPMSEKERTLIYENPAVTATRRTIPLKGEALRKGGSWDRAGINFVSYATWQVDEAMEREKLNADIVLLHGINNYAGRQADMGLWFAKQGFRVVAIDLPAFGRSTGLHCYLPSLRILVEAAHAVMIDIMEKDPPSMKNRKVFLQGESMGGFTALYYTALYPPLPDNASHADMQVMRPNIAGVGCCAPMLAIAKNSRPAPVVEKIARFIAVFAGRLPFAPGVKGNVSDDERVEIEFHQDAQTYKGWLRIATGLAILAGMQELWQLAPQITVPVALHHGRNDRATNYRGTQDFFDKISSKDKTFRVWDGYEHIMLKNVQGQSEEDNKKRMDVLNALLDFYKTRARAPTTHKSGVPHSEAATT